VGARVVADPCSDPLDEHEEARLRSRCRRGLVEAGGRPELSRERLRRPEPSGERAALTGRVHERRLDLRDEIIALALGKISELHTYGRKVRGYLGRHPGCCSHAVTSTSVSSNAVNAREKSAQTRRASASSARPRSVTP
jgi:hypothetical protein